jgi:putative spermidine/putrescine transport system ATP-binding protein
VSDVEYQGSYVLLGLQLDQAEASDKVSVMLSEAAFVQAPYHPGDRVGLTWAPEQAHSFGAA